MKRVSLLIGLIFILFFVVGCEIDEVTSYTTGQIVESIEIGYEEGDNQDHVTKDIALPSGSSLDSNIKISWISSNELIIDNFGKVNRSDEDALVDLEYTVKYLKTTFSSTITFKVISKNLGVQATYEVRYFFENIEDDAYTLEEVVKKSDFVNKDVYINPGVEEGFNLNTNVSVLTGKVLKDEIITLDVYYDRNVYDIILYDGTVILDSLKVKYGATFTVEDPIKTGFIFIDWKIHSTSVQYDLSSPVMNDLKLSATFKDENDGYIYTGYYDGAAGLYGDQLVTFLNEISNESFMGISYGDVRYILDETDADPDNPGNIILVYLGTSISGIWDEGKTWNREHVWPQSLLDSKASNPNINSASDLHNLKPSDPRTNSSRGNKFFGTTLTPQTYVPRDEVKGDVARILFYMDIMYDSLSLINANEGGANQMGNLEVLLNWHILDPVDDFEMNRNNIIENHQGNRNPFIDHPEFADKVYGHQDDVLYIFGHETIFSQMIENNIGY